MLLPRNKNHLLSIYCVHHSASCALLYLVITTTLKISTILISPFYIWISWASHRLKDLYKILEFINGRTKIWVQINVTLKSVLCCFTFIICLDHQNVLWDRTWWFPGLMLARMHQYSNWPVPALIDQFLGCRVFYFI